MVLVTFGEPLPSAPCCTFPPWVILPPHCIKWEKHPACFLCLSPKELNFLILKAEFGKEARPFLVFREAFFLQDSESWAGTEILKRCAERCITNRRLTQIAKSP